MKTINKIYKLLVFALVILVIQSCDDNSEKLEILSAENEELRGKYQDQLVQTRTSTKKADSLQTIVNSQGQEIQRMKGEMPVYNASSADEKAIEQWVANLHKGWADMMEKDDTNEILKYFLDKYTTSSVRISPENIPEVQRDNDSSFEDHLNQIMLVNDVTLSFGQTKFLYTEVRGDIFVTSYRFRLRVYRNNEQIQTNSLVTQLAGQKKDGEWKVGSYNWVTFNYDK